MSILYDNLIVAELSCVFTYLIEVYPMSRTILNFRG